MYVFFFGFLLQAIQKDVQAHSKVVLSVVKLCENLSRSDKSIIRSSTELIDSLSDSLSEETDRSDKSIINNNNNCSKGQLQILRLAHHWQRRWQLLYLKCIEWQCYIENLLQRFEDEVSKFDFFFPLK